ncbi:MAG: HIT domain-containing protein [Victivallaceae bacterium]
MSNNRPLWAPWRIDFIRGTKEERCFLCVKSSHDQDSPEEPLMIYRGTTAFVILNRYPYNSGHLMVAPYRHTGDISELTSEERLEIMNLCVSAKEVLQKVMHPDAFNIGFNLGTAAGAGLADHLHMHIVPRWNGDTNFMPVISDTRCVPEALEATARLICHAWRQD